MWWRVVATHFMFVTVDNQLKQLGRPKGTIRLGCGTLKKECRLLVSHTRSLLSRLHGALQKNKRQNNRAASAAQWMQELLLICLSETCRIAIPFAKKQREKIAARSHCMHELCTASNSWRMCEELPRTVRPAKNDTLSVIARLHHECSRNNMNYAGGTCTREPIDE